MDISPQTIINKFFKMYIYGLLTLYLMMCNSVFAKTEIKETRILKNKLTFGEQLDEKGISAHLFGSWFSFYNTYGIDKYNQQHSMPLLFALDLNLEKLIGLPNASIHFKQGLTPVATNTDHGIQLGDIYGAVVPFIAKKTRLMQLTYKQTFFDDRLEFQIGRSNPATYFNAPACDFVFTCFNPLIMMNGSVYGMPFAYWGASTRYQIDKNNFIQFGGWLQNDNIPVQNGWKWNKEKHSGNFYMLQIGRQTRFTDVAYPSRYDLSVYRSTMNQTSPSQVGQNASTGHASGIVFNWRKTFYRADGGVNMTDPTPKSLTFESGFSQNLTPKVSKGVNAYGFVGISALNFIPNRPKDTLGVRMTWMQVSKDYQRFIKAEGLKVNTPYSRSRNSFIGELNGSFSVGNSMTIDPFIDYVYNPSKHQNASSLKPAKNGFLFGLTINFALDPVLGWR